MNFVEKVRKFLNKLQNLPESQKKIIIWLVVAILAIILGFFWIKSAINTFSNINWAI